MATSASEINVRDHGKRIMSFQDKYEKAECNYCQKIVSGFTRLKQHLACVGGDVAVCDKVPEQLKEQFKTLWFQRRKIKRGKKVAAVDNQCAQAEIIISAERAVPEEQIRTINTLSSFIIAENRREMDTRINEIKSSWRRTGCSILVDGWRDVRGRDLINVIVDCPEGPVYLSSLDISTSSRSVAALQLVFEELISEVGASNVVQVMMNFSSPIFKAVAEIFEEKYRAIFWTITSTGCIEAMLESIGNMDHIRHTLNKARDLAEFISKSPAIMEIVRSHRSNDLAKNIVVPSTRPFLALENLVSEKENIKKVFLSPDWISSIWASCSEGKRVADLVADPSFWAGANIVLNATLPLLRVLYLIHRGNETQVGFLYNSMHQAKETIRNGFNNDAALYNPYMTEIDEIWEKIMCHPLHRIGHILNPRFLHSANVQVDREVFEGVLYCIVCSTEDKDCQDLIVDQLQHYIKAKGDFGRYDAVQLSSCISPVSWWYNYGGECPELQQLAIRILSQTCVGATKYNLDRSVAEKLLTERQEVVEQENLKERTRLTYFYHLDGFRSVAKRVNSP